MNKGLHNATVWFVAVALVATMAVCGIFMNTDTTGASATPAQLFTTDAGWGADTDGNFTGTAPTVASNSLYRYDSGLDCYVVDATGEPIVFQQDGEGWILVHNIYELILVNASKVKLMADIDCSDYVWNSKTLYSNSVFDGNNHTISGMYVSSGNKAGLFSEAYYYTSIKNLNIDKSYVSGGNYVGGIVGAMEVSPTTVLNCTYSGVVKGNKNVGGIIGHKVKTNVEKCEFSGLVIATSECVGGIAGGCSNELGSAFYDNYGYMHISDCHVNGKVTGTNNVGGIAGDQYYTELLQCSFNGTVTGNENVGGIAGKNDGTTFEGCDTLYVNDCTVSGSVNGKQNIGGIVGFAKYPVCLFNRCTNHATVQNYGAGSDTFSGMGGIFGQGEGATIVNCANTGDVTLNLYAAQNRVDVGGICGYTSADVYNSYNAGDVYVYSVEGEDCLYNGSAGSAVGTLQMQNFFSNCYSCGTITVIPEIGDVGDVGELFGYQSGYGFHYVSDVYYYSQTEGGGEPYGEYDTDDCPEHIGYFTSNEGVLHDTDHTFTTGFIGEETTLIGALNRYVNEETEYGWIIDPQTILSWKINPEENDGYPTFVTDKYLQQPTQENGYEVEVTNSDSVIEYQWYKYAEAEAATPVVDINTELSIGVLMFIYGEYDVDSYSSVPWVSDEDNPGQYKTVNFGQNYTYSAMTLTYTLEESAWIAFEYNVSSETYMDCLLFWENSCSEDNINEFSGTENTIQQFSEFKAPGTYVYTFMYTKDGMNAAGADMAIVRPLTQVNNVPVPMADSNATRCPLETLEDGDTVLCKTTYIGFSLNSEDAIIASNTLTFDYNGATGNNADASKRVFSTYPVGTLPSPTKPGYRFLGWFADNDVWENEISGDSVIDVDMTVYARWEVAYDVIWKNGSVTLESDLALVGGTLPEYNGTTPTKEATAQYSYTFNGWSDGVNSYAPDDTLPAVNANVTYTALFSSTVNKYTVIWKNGTTVLETDANVEYGATPTYDGVTPTKPNDETHKYSFAGWLPVISTVNGDCTYVADFTAALLVVDNGDQTTAEDKVPAQIEVPDGIDPSAHLNVKMLKEPKTTFNAPKGKKISNTYNATLYLGDSPITPSGKLTIKFAKPEGVALEGAKILIEEDGVIVEKEVRIEGENIVFETTALGDFVLITADASTLSAIYTKEVGGIKLWIIVLVALGAVVLIVLASLLIARARFCTVQVVYSQNKAPLYAEFVKKKSLLKQLAKLNFFIISSRTAKGAKAKETRVPGKISKAYTNAARTQEIGKNVKAVSAKSVYCRVSRIK